MIDTTIFENKTAVYYTLGCKLNFAETSSIGKQLSSAGIVKAQKGQEADVCVINTCSVTELADKKCRQAIRKMIKQHPNAIVLVTGCYAQLKPTEIANIEGVDMVLGSDQKQDVLNYINEFEKNNTNGTNGVFVTKTNQIKTFNPSCSNDDRTRHFLKVQDGCDYYCTYCTIPFARGRSRNGSIDSMVEQANQVVKDGGKEIVLTGVNIGDFGKSTNENFFDLIKALDNVEGIERFRISSIEPNLLTDDIIDFVATSKRFMPHFHIPLQSGNDEVLKLMRRKYDTTLFAHKIEKIKHVLPHAFIGVDVIVGVRGETDKHFEEAQKFIDTLPISQLHVFTYSERAGTKALEMDNPVDPQIKHQRSKTLLNISEQKLQEFYYKHKGTPAKVLFESANYSNNMVGFSENYIKVAIPYNANLVNNIVDVNIGNLDMNTMTMQAQFINTDDAK
ncbi:MAG: tRNA (N(6)-L-threonylcarbamoyladenosine(37)-C(2))-methylthiotransferase MtaB [Dysgonamonadaceae bacterium]|nr:tRNA (N(6)-L-threonylcarbamoyladenosine(37)-C(2))-methylthiotransferase MtaB [Dysgonamonadaceae bacterium]MDD4728082.1 tRNA (N(6)-L-threonylcarbamoyladenosine(37)-C(2))-methylthiotransferase MtaB [Dysgonamonadaceae bacterium]